MIKNHLLEEYQQIQPQLQALEKEVFSKLHGLLKTAALPLHTLSSRVKKPDSLARKLNRPDRTYHALSDITDLVGLRIITYFEDTIDEIAALVEKTFEIDYRHSIDKRKSLDASRFGYRSLHYICSYEGVPHRFEIQIRTILQHAWAETEHDLGYKSEASIPLEIRRRFSRIASLLEIADAEFSSIRSYLNDYAQQASQRLVQADGHLGVDRISLEQFLHDPEVTAIEQHFATQIDATLSEAFFYPDYLIRMLNAVGVDDMAQLRQTLLIHQQELGQFIRPYFEFTRKVWQFDSRSLSEFLRGYSLVFLAHFLILRDNALGIERLDKLAKFYQLIDYPHDENTARAVAETLLETLQSGAMNTALIHPPS
jgi:putative GTP pyrophosphokinase